MNEIQKMIKNLIEKEIRNHFEVDVVVEYVADIHVRVQEIEVECGITFSEIYKAEKTTGVFLPAINKNPYYILVQSERNDMLDVMTAFHEYQHLLDYLSFIKTVFNDDIDKLKSSPLNITFNVYSEFSATKYGVLQYIKSIQIKNLSQNELAMQLLEDATTMYRNLSNIHTRYQLLVHSMIYLGYIMACSSFIDGLNIYGLIGEMELFEALKPVFVHLLMFDNKVDWYETNNELMRTFVNGEVSY